MSFNRAKTVSAVDHFITSNHIVIAQGIFIEVGTGNFEEIEVKIGEGWDQERLLATLYEKQITCKVICT